MYAGVFCNHIMAAFHKSINMQEAATEDHHPTALLEESNDSVALCDIVKSNDVSNEKVQCTDVD